MAPVFIVCLREPGSETDYREDPYWEVGSFGCTGCHSRNLLNPTGQHVANGARFAFAQGGPVGTKLLFVTPEIKLRSFGELTEATWHPPEMPFKYLEAPLLIDSDGKTQFPQFKKFIRTSKAKPWRHKFSSKFRSRARRLDTLVATEIITVYERFRRKAARQDFAETYLDAIPAWPQWETWSKNHRPWLPAQRKAAYRLKRQQIAPARTGCGGPSSTTGKRRRAKGARGCGAC